MGATKDHSVEYAILLHDGTWTGLWTRKQALAAIAQEARAKTPRQIFLVRLAKEDDGHG